MNTSTVNAGARTVPHVLQVAGSLAQSGAVRELLSLARLVKQAGSTSLVAAPDGPAAVDLTRAGVERIDLPKGGLLPFSKNDAPDLGQMIGEHEIEVIIAWGRAGMQAVWPAAKDKDIPIYAMGQDTEAGAPSKSWYTGAMKHAAKIVVPTSFGLQHMESAHKVSPIRLSESLPHLDLAYFDPAAVGGERISAMAAKWHMEEISSAILVPGPLIGAKGHEAIIDCLPMLPNRDAVVLFTGDPEADPDYLAQLEKRAEKRGVAGRIGFVGHCGDMPAAYMLADMVLCITQTPDPFSHVIAEAQSMGRPVIASDLGSAPDLISSGETGWLVPAKDPERLAVTIQQVLDVPESQREAYKQASRDYALSRYGAPLTATDMLKQITGGTGFV